VVAGQLASVTRDLSLKCPHDGCGHSSLVLQVLEGRLAVDERLGRLHQEAEVSKKKLCVKIRPKMNSKKCLKQKGA
jgi:hypothetical protein